MPDWRNSAAPAARLLPNPDDPRLTRRVNGLDQAGKPVDIDVVVERPLTLFLNGQEIVTLMTIGDYAAELAVGYLLNQNMLSHASDVTAIDVDEELEVVVVRTREVTNFEAKLKRKTLTSGCAQGTLFGDMMETFETIRLNPDARVTVSQLLQLLKVTNSTPSLYLKAGAIHGCALCEGSALIAYMEDVGRHNAVDKIAGFMALNGLAGSDKLFYTTGRLTSEMVIKTVVMGIPILLSRSGFTAWGVELARSVGLTLIGRAKGSRFTVLSGAERLIFDRPIGGSDGSSVAEADDQ